MSKRLEGEKNSPLTVSTLPFKAFKKVQRLEENRTFAFGPGDVYRQLIDQQRNLRSKANRLNPTTAIKI